MRKRVSVHSRDAPGLGPSKLLFEIRGRPVGASAGKKRRGIVVSADGRTVYVSDQPNNQLVVVDIASRKATGVIALGESPEGVGISPDGRWVAAAVEETNDVAFVDTRTQRKAFVIKVRGKNPEHAVFAPDGRHVFVSAEEGEAVDVIDVATAPMPHLRTSLSPFPRKSDFWGRDKLSKRRH